MRRSSCGWREACHPCSFARLRATAGASSLFVTSLLLAPAADARADDGVLAVHIVVEAPASCTNEERFWAEVTKRTAEIRRAASAAPDVPTLTIRASEADGRARGELFLRVADDEVLAPRHVNARTCAEVTAALALAFVLAMEEGELRTRPPPAPHEQEHAPERPPPRRTDAGLRPSPRRDADEPAGVTTSMGAQVIVGGIDGAAFGTAIFSDLRPAELDRRLSVRLQATALRRTVAREAGEAVLSWALMRARLCVHPSTGFTIALCALVEGGAFAGTATQARNPLSYVGPWAGAGFAMGATWMASARWGIDVEAGILAPFVRDDLVLQPRAVLFSTPPATMWVGIGPVLRF